MPAILARYEPEDRTDFEAYKEELRNREETINRVWKYYHGKHDKFLKLDSKGVDHNVVINITSQALDKMVAFFVPETPQILIRGGNDLVGKPLELRKTLTQLLIDAIWAENEVESFILDLAQAGFVSGHSFVRIINREKKFPEFVLLDARNVTLFWNVNNTKQILYYRVSWKLSENTSVIQDIVPNWLFANTNLISPEPENNGWVTIQYLVTTGKKFEVQGREPWDFNFPPIVAWKNSPAAHSVYGLSDLRHTELNDTVNFIASNTNKIIYHHAGPQTIVTGGVIDDAEEKKTGPSTIVQFSDPETKVYNLELKGDLAASMAMLDVARASFFGQMRVVDMAQIGNNLARVTNFGVRLIHGDMLDMITARRNVYGKGIGLLTQIALFLLGEGQAFSQQIETVFADPLPVDRLSVVQALEGEQRISALSQQTISQDLGRNYTAEIANLTEEREQEIQTGEQEQDVQTDEV